MLDHSPLLERAIVLAAGRGSRLVGELEPPKPLKTVASVPLLVRILRTLEGEGIREAVIVIGDRGESIRQALERETSLGLALSFVENAQYHLKNGVSLLAARAHIDGECLLTMADHLYSPRIVRRLRAFALPPGACALAVDRHIAACFDLDDATKVKLVSGARDARAIAHIGKELADYDALDTGVFRIGPALIDELDAVYRQNGDCSLSDGVGALAARGHFLACDVGDARWIDVDTPEACAQAEAMIARHGDSLDGLKPAVPAELFVPPARDSQLRSPRHA